MHDSICDSPAWGHTTDYLLGEIRDALDDSSLADELPELKSLMDDYLDEHFELDRVEFHRRLLRVFRDSPRDQTYQDHLALLDELERERLEHFVADDIPVDECSHGFDMGMSMGAREHLSHMLQVDAVTIGHGGPVHIRGLSDGDLARLDGVLHRFVKGLGSMLVKGATNLLCCAGKLPEGTGDKILHTDEIIVGVSFPNPKIWLLHGRQTDCGIRCIAILCSKTGGSRWRTRLSSPVSLQPSALCSKL